MTPLRFDPLVKRIRWGGTRLGTVLGKPIGTATDAAESWEICDHGADQSIVCSGPEKGQSLGRIVNERGAELLGLHAGLSQFPLLIKFLDAHDRLSVQVHPNDEQARALPSPDNGKTEAWLIIAAEAGSCVYAGLKSGCDRAACERALKEGTLEECLHRVEVAAGDCFFIEAGTVHAIGEGILLAEVQQSSNVTFRLFDWGRVGTDGKPRELHIEQSLACIDFERGPVGKVRPIFLPGASHRAEELVRCAYFVMRRHTFSREIQLPNDLRCHILTVLEGRAGVQVLNTSAHLKMGDTVLVPACGLPAQIVPEGEAILLETFLP